MNAALHQNAIIFTALAAGLICRKPNITTEEGTQVLSSVVVYVIFPLSPFGAILTSEAGIGEKT